jgi:hypothetical protein
MIPWTESFLKKAMGLFSRVTLSAVRAVILKNSIRIKLLTLTDILYHKKRTLSIVDK